MVGKELEAGGGDCKFPNVRKTYWRSATWNAQSAPLSPNLQPFHAGDDGGGVSGGGEENAAINMQAFPAGSLATPRSQHQLQNNRIRTSLPPLSISRKSLEEWPKAGLDDMTDWTTPATPGRRRVKTGPDIKLDLASVQRSTVEPTEIQLKRDKFAHFDKQCSRVGNHHIYLGSDAVARDRDTLFANGITHVLNCVGFVCPEYFKQDFVYKTLWLQDSPCEDITSLLYDVFDYFEDVREQGGRVFVHCCQGVSRSTSLVIAYLMWRERRSFEDAFQDVKAARGVTNPNMGFACQLLQCQKRVHAAPMSPNSVLRLYRLAPHSPYDPLHLVPKAVNNPGAGALDSRGAFVVHVPYAIYVWIGKACHPKMALAAKCAAGQVVRYERAEGPILILFEGQESPDFWKSLNKHSNELSTTGNEVLQEEAEGLCLRPDNRKQRIEVDSVGSKKVSLYDVDFDLYQRAREGGVVPPVPSMVFDVASKPTRVPAREDGWSVLRRKFLLGELVSTKEREELLPYMDTGPIEKSITNVPSPDTSMSLSSPSFSPFSATSVSSSGLATSDSSFASPVSLLDDPFVGATSPPVDSVVSTCPLHKGGLPTLPIYTSFSSSLAWRRGSIPPTLRLPRLEDDPPPAPRAMSRKPRLPSLVMTGSSGDHNAGEQSEDPTFVLKESGKICKKLENCGDDQNSGPAANVRENLLATETSSMTGCKFTGPVKIASEKRHATLFTWPGLDRIDMFDIDDLDSNGVFVLHVSHLDGNNQLGVVYVWVGQESPIEEELLTGNAENFQQVGLSLLERMQLPSGTLIQIVREGQELEDFWEIFKHG